MCQAAEQNSALMQAKSGQEGPRLDLELPPLRPKSSAELLRVQPHLPAAHYLSQQSRPILLQMHSPLFISDALNRFLFQLQFLTCLADKCGTKT